MEDIVIAQKIVSGVGRKIGNETMFHNTSAIYKITNERSQDYQNYFKNKKSMLSVIASGDQILNAILEGVKEVDAFDISRFPKYFLYLKIAAIKALSREEYVDFFYGFCKDAEIYDEMYDRISTYLSTDMKTFWDSLFNFFDWNDIYNSMLFSSEPCFEGSAIQKNKYLSNDDEYKKLQMVIDDVIIRTYEGDILSIGDKFDRPFDLIYLSNIIYYVNRDKYKEVIKKLPVVEKGIILTYIYRIQKEVSDFFFEDNFSIEQFVNSDAGVVLFRK